MYKYTYLYDIHDDCARDEAIMCILFLLPMICTKTDDMLNAYVAAEVTKQLLLTQTPIYLAYMQVPV